MSDNKISGDILKGHIATMLLSVIADEPRHGYEIMKILSERSDGVFGLGQGTVYPMLYTLEEEGLIVSRERTVGGRRRRMYFLTAAGRKRLVRKKAAWHVFVSAVNNVLGPSKMEVLSHVSLH